MMMFEGVRALNMFYDICNFLLTALHAILRSRGLSSFSKFCARVCLKLDVFYLFFSQNCLACLREFRKGNLFTFISLEMLPEATISFYIGPIHNRLIPTGQRLINLKRFNDFYCHVGWHGQY